MTPGANGDCLAVPHPTSLSSPPLPPPVFNLCSSGLLRQQQPPSPPQQHHHHQAPGFSPQPHLNMSTTESSSSTLSGSKKGTSSPFFENVPEELALPPTDTSATFLQNIFQLASDHDAQMSQKDDIIRKLMSEKAELEQSMLTIKSSLELIQLEREAVEDKDRARKAEKVKEEATACLSQALAKQEKKGWDVVTKVLRAMECICCYEARPRVKVYQCVAGHLICEHCRIGLQDPVCPACTTKYTLNIRSLLAEELALTLNLNDY